jgi:hypothetical protein
MKPYGNFGKINSFKYLDTWNQFLAPLNWLVHPSLDTHNAFWEKDPLMTSGSNAR